jgi:L-ribulose-5-phosphate 3-epimerase UlaE
VLKKLIVHMHLDDGRTSGVSEHLPLGEGRADFSPLAHFIANMQGAAVLEIYAPDRPVQATIESRDYLLRVLQEAGVCQ